MQSYLDTELFGYRAIWTQSIFIPKYLDIWIAAYQNTRVPGRIPYMDTMVYCCIPGNLDTWIHGYLDTCIPGYHYIWIPVYLDIWIPGYLDSWIPVYLGTRIPRHQNTKISEHLDSCTCIPGTRMPKYQNTWILGYL